MSDMYNKNDNFRNTGVYNFDEKYKETKYNDDIAGILKTARQESLNKQAKIAARRKAKKRKIMIRLSIVLIAMLLALILVISGLVAVVRGIASLAGSGKDKETIAQLISSANAVAATYDYDKAIEIIKSYGEKYEKKKDLKAAVFQYQSAKSNLVKFADNSQIPHISFRTLICDPAKAFDNDDSQDKYDRNMITTTEFTKILDSLYNRGYVLVDINHIAKRTDGKMAWNEIYLPRNKKPIVLSQENVSYYSSLKGNGFASKIVLDENGNPMCEYVDDEGNVSVGAYDLVPILEAFIKEHPDFSYRGARATLAVTGYDGVLGYRTDPNGDGYQPDDAEKAKTVANRLKELGYTFASNSWDYISYGNHSLSRVKEDADHWEATVAQIVGKTNVLIFAGTTDIVNSGEYKDNNEKFNYLKSKGFSVFCPVNEDTSSVTMGTDYLRQGRRSINGKALYNHPDRLQDLFDAAQILDSARPGAKSENIE